MDNNQAESAIRPLPIVKRINLKLQPTSIPYMWFQVLLTEHSSVLTIDLYYKVWILYRRNSVTSQFEWQVVI